jgi:hypothetical protein
MTYNKKPIIVLIVLFFVVMFAGCNIKDSQEYGVEIHDAAKERLDSDREYIWTDEEISRAFFKGDWKFFKGSDELLGVPIEAFLKLVAVKEGEKRILPSTKSFKGYVQIRNSNDALSFVRLFTDIDTHYLFEDSEYIEVCPTIQKPSWGELSAQDFADLGLSEPLVTKDGEFFLIVRYVVDDNRNIFQIHEQVSVLGDYQIVKKTPVAKDVKILTPIYE